MMLDAAAAGGVRLIVWCRECQHQVEPDPAEQARRYGDGTTVPDWRERLVCSRCGSRRVDMVVTGTMRRWSVCEDLLRRAENALASPKANVRRCPVGVIETSAALAACLLVLAVAVALDRRPYRPGKRNYIPIMIIAVAASLVLGRHLLGLVAYNWSCPFIDYRSHPMDDLEQRHLREREKDKEEAVAAVDELLAAIEQELREPDPWERFHLVEAIGAIFRGACGSGSAEIDRARTPPERRGIPPELREDPVTRRGWVEGSLPQPIEASRKPQHCFPRTRIGQLSGHFPGLLGAAEPLQGILQFGGYRSFSH
jgi:hypothetical protein